MATTSNIQQDKVGLLPPEAGRSKMSNGLTASYKSKSNLRSPSFSSFVTTLLNSYSILFFSQSRILAVFVLSVSFLNPLTGLCGFIATAVAAAAGYGLGFTKQQLNTGYYTYSSLLLGLGMGALYELSFAMWLVLALASLFAFMLSALLIARFARNNLPALSLPFIFTLWLVMLAAKGFTAIGLAERNIYWLNEMYAIGGSTLINAAENIEYLPWPSFISGFFRSLSAVLFQNNLAAGILLAIGILLYSRIALVLMVIGYSLAIAFHVLLYGSDAALINYYNLGTNFMLTALAVGGIYLIPSIRSYFWVMLLVPVAYLVAEGTSKVTQAWGLPVFSLPFCMVVIIYLYTLGLRAKTSKLILTPVQFFNPETNLYRYLNNKENVLSGFYLHLSLPFMGEWFVSQGYDGNITHKGEWSKALDFVVLDSEMRTYRHPGTSPEHFYCYNKPVLAPADGIVEEIVDNINDNAIGANNTAHNWGNTIIIKHASGLYSQLSHLKINSFRVQKGMFVKKGDIVAAVGNSGRSPEPHLHFQVQATPHVGSKTLIYPLGYTIIRTGLSSCLTTFTQPAEGSFIRNITFSDNLKKAFNLQPGLIIKASAKGYITEEWEVKTTAYNESYLYCQSLKVSAYFVNNGTMFYFTAYYGSRKSLLYSFFLAAFKVLLTSDRKIEVKGNLPQNMLGLHWLKWFQDLVSPFYIFMRIAYKSAVSFDEGALSSRRTVINSAVYNRWFGKSALTSEALIRVENGTIESFIINKSGKKVTVACEVSNG